MSEYIKLDKNASFYISLVKYGLNFTQDDRYVAIYIPDVYKSVLEPSLNLIFCVITKTISL